jgi:serine phosphatase RsbU (regulator of sigma subunit)
VAWLVVADVCGSGSAAAPQASDVLRVLTALTTADLTPSALLTSADRALSRERAHDRFVTATAVRLRRTGDGVETTVATAGHPHPLVWADGDVRALAAAGRPLNLPAAEPLPVVETEHGARLTPGDLLLAHTDGLTDRSAVDRTDVLADLFRASGDLRDPRAVTEVITTAMDVTTGVARDDLALVVLSIR